MADGPDPTAPYQALYRRYRPQRFADVLGQEHVTRALSGAVRDGKVAHAYLFSGPRGTGKTSTARILAMALNCENPEGGEPDGTCASCVAIRQGSSLDVQELDSATNRGIDEMKDLLSRVALGTPGRWKVYIVDEVHQLTPAAASALLKTLEEPPGHVIFVLATTDAQKVLPTIRSRTQHFEFRLLGPESLASLLHDVNERAGLGLPPEAIDLVVRRGHGSARDALSVLDQVAAAGDVDDEATVVSDLVDAIADRDPGRVLVEVAEAVTAGRDPRRIGTEVLEHLRNGFLASQARSLVMLADDAAAIVEAQARRLGPAMLVRAMEVVGQALIDMREAVDPRITLEVALVRLASPDTDDSRAALVERIERLERALESGAGGARPAPSREASTGAAAPAEGGAPPGPRRGSGEPLPGRALGDPPPLPGTGGGAGGRATLGALRGSRPPADPDASAGSGAPPAPAGPAGSAGSGPPAGSAGSGPPAGSGGSGPPAGSAGPAGSGGSGPPRDPAPSPASSQPAAPIGSAGSDPPTAPSSLSSPPPPGPPAELAGSAEPAPLASPPSPPPVPGRAPESGSEPVVGSSVLGGAGPASAPRPLSRAGPPVATGEPDPAGSPRARAAGSSQPLPSREDLTLAWGDSVLGRLPANVKPYLSSGRFLGVDGAAAVYALKDPGMLARAQLVRPEAEAALARHFGRPVPLRLVLDDGSRPGSLPVADHQPAVAAEADEEFADYDLSELEDAPAGVASPEQRLLEAFPGAEEVLP